MRKIFASFTLIFLFSISTNLVQAESVETTDSSRPVVCTREYRPVCGKIDSGIRCITAPCPSYEAKTFGNICEMGVADADFLHEGECSKLDVDSEGQETSSVALESKEVLEGTRVVGSSEIVTPPWERRGVDNHYKNHKRYLKYTEESESVFKIFIDILVDKIIFWD